MAAATNPGRARATFSNLPFELRLKIYRDSFPKPRTIQIITSSEVFYPPYNLNKPLGLPELKCTVLGSTPIVALEICSESRAEAIQYYKPIRRLWKQPLPQTCLVKMVTLAGHIEERINFETETVLFALNMHDNFRVASKILRFEQVKHLAIANGRNRPWSPWVQDYDPTILATILQLGDGGDIISTVFPQLETVTIVPGDFCLPSARLVADRHSSSCLIPIDSNLMDLVASWNIPETNAQFGTAIMLKAWAIWELLLINTPGTRIKVLKLAVLARMSASDEWSIKWRGGEWGDGVVGRNISIGGDLELLSRYDGIQRLWEE